MGGVGRQLGSVSPPPGSAASPRSECDPTPSPSSRRCAALTAPVPRWRLAVQEAGGQLEHAPEARPQPSLEATVTRLSSALEHVSADSRGMGAALWLGLLQPVAKAGERRTAQVMRFAPSCAPWGFYDSSLADDGPETQQVQAFLPPLAFRRHDLRHHVGRAVRRKSRP
jgi:hypothetical protein